MKVLNLSNLSKMDHADVKEQAGTNEKQRRAFRMAIIKKFIHWSKANSAIWQENKEEKIVLQRQRNFNRMLCLFGGVANFFIYQAFLTGTYNYRNTELLRMRTVPFVVKIFLSSAVSGYMAYALYNDSLYSEDLYRISLKYRLQYDEQY